MKMITFLMKHIMLRAIFQFFFENAEFVCSVDKYYPSVVKERFLVRDGNLNDLGDLLPK